MNKFFLSLKLNIFAVLAAVLNFLEFLKLAILRVFVVTEESLVSLGVIVWLFFSVFSYYIYKDIGFTIYAVIIFGLIIGVITYVISLVFPILTLVLNIIFNVFNLVPAILFLNRKVAEAFNEYMENSASEPGSTKIPLLPTYMIFLFSKAIKKGFSLIRILALPLSAAFFGWCSYTYVFVMHAAPTVGDNDYIPSVVLVLILTIAGVCFVNAVFDTIKASFEDTDFGFLDILFWYFGNEDYSSGQSKEQDHTAETATENASNSYYDFFASASTYEDLKRMYRQKMKEFHPDNAKDMSIEFSTKESAKINEAFNYYKTHKFNK